MPPQNLRKVLDHVQNPVYVIGHGCIEYANPALLVWVGDEEATHRMPVSGTGKSIVEKMLLESLTPPLATSGGFPVFSKVRPVTGPDAQPRPPKDVLFIPLVGDDEGTARVIAVADCRRLTELPVSVVDAMAISEQLAVTRRDYPKLKHLALLAGASHKSAWLRDQVSLAANTNANVFLSGRPGCGSEKVALAIHRMSFPGEFPIVSVDCSLMDIELFEAATSPSVTHLQSNPGNRATLLLRKVDQLPPEAQLRLATILAESGSRLRCFSLSQYALNECIQAERLLNEIAYKLGTFEIRIPSLQERMEDFSMMVHALIQLHSSVDRPVTGMTRPALDMLSIYPWPGDFEELELAVRHAVEVRHGMDIQPQNLPLVVRTYDPKRPQDVDRDRAIDLDRFLLKIERELMKRALENSGGNRAEAARRLGISRSRLLRRLADDQAN